MDPPFDRQIRLFLSSLRDSRAGKAQGKHFCSRRACSASQKCSSQRTGRCCGLHLEGLRPLQTTPGFSFFPVFTVAHSSMRTNIPVNKEDIADWLLQHPLSAYRFFQRRSSTDCTALRCSSRSARVSRVEMVDRWARASNSSRSLSSASNCSAGTSRPPSPDRAMLI